MNFWYFGNDERQLEFRNIGLPDIFKREMVSELRGNFPCNGRLMT